MSNLKLNPLVQRYLTLKGLNLNYPNQYYLSKQRQIVLDSVNNKCELCGETAIQVHHRDFNKSNHTIENLSAMCIKCHMRLHRERKQKQEQYDGEKEKGK